jgi:hypothetical protein
MVLPLSNCRRVVPNRDALSVQFGVGNDCFFSVLRYDDDRE